MSPLLVISGKKADVRAALAAKHSVSVQLDLVQSAISLRGRIGELSQCRAHLRWDR